jgi:hypothetical protein
MDIQQEANLAKPKKSPDDLPEWLKDFRDVFEPKEFDQPDTPPISPQKVISLPQHHCAELREFLDANEASGRIRPSTSPYAASFFFVPKHDGRSQPTQDYCWLNAHTIHDKYPLPRIEALWLETFLKNGHLLGL